jgi:hypothetical protein
MHFNKLGRTLERAPDRVRIGHAYRILAQVVFAAAFVAGLALRLWPGAQLPADYSHAMGSFEPNSLFWIAFGLLGLGYLALAVLDIRRLPLYLLQWSLASLSDGLAEALKGHQLILKALGLLFSAVGGWINAILFDLVCVQLIRTPDTALTLRHFLDVLLTLAALFVLGLAQRGCLRANSAVAPVAEVPNGPIVLFLRSFASDHSLHDLGLLFAFGGAGHTEEQRIADLFGGLAPVVSLAQPDEPPELGAKRFISTENWKATIASLVDRALVVIVRLSLTPAVIWELQLLRGKQPGLPVLFLLPYPVSKGEADPYSRLASALAEATGWPFPGQRGYANMLFFRSDREPVLLKTIETGQFRTLKSLLRPFFEATGLRPPTVGEPLRLFHKGMLAITLLYGAIVTLLLVTVGIPY